MNNRALDIFSAFFCFLLVVAIACIVLTTISVASETGAPAGDYVSGACLILTCIFSIYYSLAGCKKSGGSKYYICFMGAQAVCDLVSIATLAGYTVWGTVALAVSVACCTVLAFAKDLGEKKSTAFALVNLVSEIIVLVFAYIATGRFPVRVATSALLAFATVFMVLAKYYDKRSRGSK